MQIESIHIVSFGGLRNFTLELSSGLSVIEGPNESGKSTIAAFIKFMLYGFSSKDERALHTSWDGEAAEGSMVIIHNNSRYRIGRRCAEGRDEWQIIDCATNMQCYKGRQPGEVFLGVDSDVFEHTAYVSQIGGGRVDGEVVAEAIGNILFSADETTNVQRALKRLEEERVRLWHKNKRGGLIYELECQRDELLERRRAASSDYAAIVTKEGQLADLKAKIKENAEKIEKLSKIIGAYETKRRMEKRAAIDKLYSRIEEIEARQRELEEKYKSEGGFLPDEEYLAELENAKKALENVDIRISEVEKHARLVGSGTEDEQPETALILQKYGGEKGALQLLESTLGRRRALLAFGVIFALLFVPATVITVSLTMISYAYGAIAGLGTLALLFGFVMCFASASKYSRVLGEMLDDFGADSVSELRRLIGEAAAYKAPQSPDKAAVYIESEREKLLAQRREANLALERLLSRWGKRTLDEALSAIAEYKNAAAELNEERKKVEAELTGALAQVGGDVDGETEDPTLVELAKRLPADFNIANAKREHEFLTKANASMAARTHELELELATLNARVNPPAMIADQITAIDYKLASLRKRYKAIELAVQTLQGASENMRQSVAPRLSEYAGRMMEAFSGGKYKSIAVASDLSLSYDAGTGALTRHGIEFMSAGTQDIAYISLRLALVNLLFRKGNPPLIFDESFARLDEGRLRNVLRLLEKAAEGTQIIILTAQPREYALLTSKARRIRI
ncbi:MAG TPA: AAA family ATPase [Clostridiales bacterium]|nr:AAA family ATPase [Clostridiales bacterium]